MNTTHFPTPSPTPFSFLTSEPTRHQPAPTPPSHSRVSTYMIERFATVFGSSNGYQPFCTPAVVDRHVSLPVAILPCVHHGRQPFCDSGHQPLCVGGRRPLSCHVRSKQVGCLVCKHMTVWRMRLSVAVVRHKRWSRPYDCVLPPCTANDGRGCVR